MDEKGKLLNNYTIRIVRSDCNPSSEKVNALVELGEDIREVLPYLNNLLRGYEYSDEEKLLTVKWEGHLITFRPRQIAITKLEDEGEANSVMVQLQKIINETYANRESLEPRHTRRSLPQPLEVYKLLPKTNCKQCGEATCMAFALKLMAGDRTPKECLPLLEETFKANYQTLTEFFPND